MTKKQWIITISLVIICALAMFSFISSLNVAPAESAFVVQRYDVGDVVPSEGTGQVYYHFTGIVGDKLVFSCGYYSKGYNIFMGFSGVGYEFTLGDTSYTLTDYDVELGNWIELGSWSGVT